MLVPQESEGDVLVSRALCRRGKQTKQQLTPRLLLVRLSIPYSPPSRAFLSHKEMAKRVPQLGYMAYFDEERATKEIERNVRSVASASSFSVFPSDGPHILFIASQITTFIRSIFQSGAVSIKISEWTKVDGLRKILLGSSSSGTALQGYLLDEEVSTSLPRRALILHLSE